MNHPDPMAAEFERIEAELAAQNRMLEQLHQDASAYGDARVAVSRDDLNAIDDACAETGAVRPTPMPAGIRC